MSEERKLSINMAEVMFQDMDGDAINMWHHAFLLLIDETGEDQVVIQQIHFSDGKYREMIPNARDGGNVNEHLDKFTIFPYIVGNEEAIMPMWNHALDHGISIKDSGITFGLDYQHSRDANNCRSGVKASITSMGLTFCEEFTKSVAGLNANEIPVGKIFSFDDIEDETCADLWAENEKLVSKLPFDFIPDYS